MATTSYGVNDALAVKLWSKRLAVEAPKHTAIAPLIGTSKDSIIVRQDETSKSAGDKVTMGLRMQLTGKGVTEGGTLEGNEEALTTYSDSLFINELRHGVRVKNKDTIDQQRVLHGLRMEAKDGLRDWFADRMSLMFFTQACGYTGSTMTFEGTTLNMSESVYYGFNAPTAPSTNRHIWSSVSGTITSDQTLTSTDIFTLDLIDRVVARAKTANPRIRPVMVNGQKKFVMYVHPYQVHSLRTNTSTGQWLDITKAINDASKQKSLLYDGALGEYNGVILREAEHVTTGVNSATSAEISTVRRAVLLGAQSACIAFGKNTNGLTYKWVEDTHDYEEELGVTIRANLGVKKTVFNSEDFGTYVVSTYAAAP